MRRRLVRLQTAEKLVNPGYWRWEAEAARLEVSSPLARLCGWDAKFHTVSLEQYLGIVHRDDRERVRAAIYAAETGVCEDCLSYRLSIAGGSVVVVEQAIRIERESPLVLHGAVRNITSQHESKQQIERLANFDPLTGLASRGYLLRHMASRIAECADGGSFGVMVVELDDFRDVNDSLGHDAGDALLTTVGGQVRSLLRTFLEREGYLDVSK